jgi:3-hydroxyacyl-CoA dehydrogenase
MQSAGLIGVRKDLRVWGEDSAIWAAPDLLDQAIKDARGFDSLG